MMSEIARISRDAAQDIFCLARFFFCLEALRYLLLVEVLFVEVLLVGSLICLSFSFLVPSLFRERAVE